MEIFMANIHLRATKFQVQSSIAQVLHGPLFSHYSSSPLNFEVRLFSSQDFDLEHIGKGVLTVPTEEIGIAFLQEFSGAPTWVPRYFVHIHGMPVTFAPSKRAARWHVVEKILRLPYVDVDDIQRQQKLAKELQSSPISIRTIQFGWETRDRSFSVEWERESSYDCRLVFGAERRELRVDILEGPNFRSIVVPLSRIQWSAARHEESQGSIIFLSLSSPPSFERLDSSEMRVRQYVNGASGQKQERLLALYPEDRDHVRILPYTSIAIRLVCKDKKGLSEFRRLGQQVHIPVPRNFCHWAEYRNLFSTTNLTRYHFWLNSLDWSVAFQVEAISRSLLADVQEILGIQHFVDRTVRYHGSALASELLRNFANQVSVVDASTDTEGSFQELYIRCEQDFLQTPRSPIQRFSSDESFQCYHVSVTPTTMKLEGPLPERSNRVMRMYPDDHDRFIRVSFVEENHLQYQHNRDVDGPAFVNTWVRRILLDGISVAGLRFQFLAYSQSALKSHAVWFVLDDPWDRRVSVPSIIKQLGTFDNLPFDETLVYCPARYGARISQAFTATDSSIVVEAEEIMILKDIKKNRWCFTDGVGTISRELAREIWMELRKKGKRATRRAITHPRAFQVRFMGSKGMLSVDHKLSGRAICLRPSMIKFEAPESREVEIARAFFRPSKFYLNRPLIMILEDLGVPYHVFENLQKAAVREVEMSTKSFERAAHMFEQFGLGTSFRLPSILLNLHKLGLSPFKDDFYQQMSEFAIHHILRDLKHHARIPVPDGYTLVGVADVHNYLDEYEVFACIAVQDKPVIYLEGPVLISRSPTIHPGDVQVVHAIGRPPSGSPFAVEPLPNTVVFSTKGERPLPSYLGGGDLDGDLYNVTTMPELLPSNAFDPAAYIPAPKKFLDRPSTMNDVAEFVADYIISDVLGLVAVTWLIIADQSHEDGIFDPDCLALGQVHSDAVDYPKSGQPISMDEIPKLKFKSRPDWNAPETVDAASSANFYQTRRQFQTSWDFRLDDVLERLSLDAPADENLALALEERVSDFIDREPDRNYMSMAIELFHKYAMDLQSICAANAISPHRLATLTEEEAVVGTIVAKCSQKRKRKDNMAQLREQTNTLVKTVRDMLGGEDDEPYEEWLHSAWAAWKVSRLQSETFGSKSFGWIALGEIFDAIKAIEQERSQWGFWFRSKAPS
ncbi:hypothetical protein EW146_g1088 [Bondarzewia mesenterica]|uniref:RNA-dependent RNA polymerase n=1 Tax=Bondarzewia mesenterica TaxID=1095465 RepID=A0A4S4M5E5_9AGAM|nr:hypothetical protein EW146_g1088 [Bondarzewia mesenterica]